MLKSGKPPASAGGAVTPAYAWISYGLGGAAIDPASGEQQLVARLKAIGVHCSNSPYSWNDLQTIVDQILAAPHGIKLIVGGDSLGANEAPAIAKAVQGKRNIDFLFGFQRSQWGVEQCGVPSNVVEALSIYNPIWIETLGLGDDPWTLEAGNDTTKLTNVPMEAAHPDDFGAAQDMVFDRIKAIIGA